VEVELHRCLLDAAGNALDASSAQRVAFRTRATSLCEVAEDFADAVRADVPATSCGWDDPETPGVLMARTGSVLVGALADDVPPGMPAVERVRFQLLFPGDEMPAGLASALRVELADAPEGAELCAAQVDGGETSLELRDPSFLGNRDASRLRTLAVLTDAVPVENSTERAPAAVEIPFEEPLRLEPGRAVLLEVTLVFSPRVRVASAPDALQRALVEGCSEVVPSAALVASPSAPQARSLWYDSGADVPGWQRATVVGANFDPDLQTVVEYQAAPARSAGGIDIAHASPWVRDLAHLPAYRYVRFRVRFDGGLEDGASPRIDRIVLPYER
jgi:hypothetical protein